MPTKHEEAENQKFNRDHDGVEACAFLDADDKYDCKQSDDKKGGDIANNGYAENVGALGDGEPGVLEASVQLFEGQAAIQKSGGLGKTMIG